MEQKGYVKLHRKILDNDILYRDLSAYVVFTRLMLVVNRMNGTYTTGRFRIAELTMLKPTTAYSALKRLEKAKIISLSSDNKMTVISICNWSSYQSSDDNKMTANRQQNDTKQELKIENKETNTNVELHSQIRQLYLVFCSEFEKNENQYKLSDQRKKKLAARIRDCGFDMVEQAIRTTAKIPFFRGDNDRGWQADLDFITRSYEKVEQLANKASSAKELNIEEALKTL